MVNRNRQTIRTVVETLTYDLDGSIDDAIKTLQRIQREQPTGRLCYEDVAGSYSEARMGLAVIVDVPETDDQMNKRIIQEEQWESLNESNERAKFEELKKKFGE